MRGAVSDPRRCSLRVNSALLLVARSDSGLAKWPTEVDTSGTVWTTRATRAPSHEDTGERIRNVIVLLVAAAVVSTVISAAVRKAYRLIANRGRN